MNPCHRHFWLLCCLATVALRSLGADPKLPDRSIKEDPTLGLRGTLTLVTNEHSTCASGFTVTIENLNHEKPFMLEIAQDLRETFTTSVFRSPDTNQQSTVIPPGYVGAAIESRRISRKTIGFSVPRQSIPITYDNISLLPGTARAWSLNFSDIILPQFQGSKLVTNCSVYVQTLTNRKSDPTRSLSTSKTNVCISLP
jgi:hypothetical protein